MLSVSDALIEWNHLLNVEKTIYRDDNDETPYTSICSVCLAESTFKYIVKAAFYGICFVGMCLEPIINFVKDDTQNTVYYVRLPFGSNEDRVMHFFNIIWQTFINLFGLWGILAFEFMITLISNTITVSSKLTVFDLNELNNEIENKSITRDQTRRKLQKIVDDIEFMDKSVEIGLLCISVFKF